jgi:hypothetical protein
MISFTTDANVVNKFYDPSRGIIVTKEVPADLIIPQISTSSTESEVLVLHMIKNVRILEK